MSDYKTLFLILSCSLFFNLAFAQKDATSQWFPFEPNTNLAHSVINMNDWLDAPAGNHGFLKMQDDKLVFEDGTAIKFWGVNISSYDVFSSHEDADTWSTTLANYGVNAVRFHKFSHPGMDEFTSTQLKDENYEKMDYFSSKLKEKGIYYGWSPIYGHNPKVADSSFMLAYEEIAEANLNGHLSFSTIGLVNFAKDLQDLHISLFTNLLNHKNPYNNLKYADDPALIFIEIQNEDNIYFATNEQMINKCPSYKKILTLGFHQWLKDKYQTQENLQEKWGSKAFEWGEEVMGQKWNLDSLNITPAASHGIYNYEYEKATKSKENLPIFLADMATYLYELQSDYYARLSTAIKATGYKGQIISTNWQAGSGITHYLNLHTDYKTGMIDRHNYYGGGTGHTLKPGIVHNESMVSHPGTGLLSTGMQQVVDRPFSISEWLSLIPNQWTAESAPIIAAYGMGLQGWDSSFAFNSEYPTFTPALEQPNIHWPGVYNVMSPNQLALYPALASMIYRGDVEEGEIVSVRQVGLNDLKKGKLGFEEMIHQKGDVKSFKGSVPTEALAIGKVVIAFSNDSSELINTDLSKYWDKHNEVIHSNTKQLEWNYSEKGYFTINTPGTKGFVGFSDSTNIDFGKITLQTNNEFAVIILSSLDQQKIISNTDRILISCMARVRNSGMKYNESKTELLEVGKSPILIEPVDFNITFKDKIISSVNILDHVGNRTGKAIASKSNHVYINSTQEKTIYYEVIFKE